MFGTGMMSLHWQKKLLLNAASLNKGSAGFWTKADGQSLRTVEEEQDLHGASERVQAWATIAAEGKPYKQAAFHDGQ